MKLLSWNVNGLGAAERKGFIDWALHESPDILCLQEVRARKDQIPKEILEIKTCITNTSININIYLRGQTSAVISIVVPRDGFIHIFHYNRAIADYISKL